MAEEIEFGTMRLHHPYYYGQVVGTSVDPGRNGGVQARISGVTDLWEDKLQPWVYPQLMQGMIQVPQVGHWLLIRFKDGDISQGLYYAISPTKNFTPEQFMAGYPDIAVMNLGETGYLYTHNRLEHTSTITNPGNNSTIIWDERGEVSMTSTNYSPEEGNAAIPVLTEATIDIFSCMPVGSPTSGIRAGSEYLSVSHISKQTIDTLRGGGIGAVKKANTNGDAQVDGEEKREIKGVSNEYGIPFMESPASVRRSGKAGKRIIFAATGGRPLAEYASMYCNDGAKECAHFLVGVDKGDLDILSDQNDSNKTDYKPENKGFVQCVELKYDATLGNDMEGKPNLDAVSVMFYGTGELTEYQRKVKEDIINTIKNTFNGEYVECVAYNPPRATAAQLKAYEKLKFYEGEV